VGQKHTGPCQINWFNPVEVTVFGAREGKAGDCGVFGVKLKFVEVAKRAMTCNPYPFPACLES
jgi:hypothetical protein